MRAAVMHRFHDPLAIEEVAVEEPRAGEVLVRIAASGVCGSDVHAWHGRSNVTKTFPIILGHEGAGVIEAAGPGVTGLARGDHVVIAMFGPCGRCDYCGTGQLEYCDGPSRRSMYGEMPDGSTRLSQDGAPIYPYVGVGSFGEYAVVRAEMVVKVKPDLPLDKLCIAACGVTTGLGAVFNVAQVTPGSSVLVVGCGGVGLNVVQGARIAGAAKIIAVDTNPAKLDLAADFGASHCLKATEDPAELDAAVRQIAPKGVNYAFDVVGSPALIRQLLGLTAMGGTTVAVGVVPWATEIGGPAGLFLFGERKLTGVMGGSNRPVREIGRIVDLYEQGRLKLDELVGRTQTLDEIGAAIEGAVGGDWARTVIRIDERLL